MNFIYNDHVIDDEVIEIITGPAVRIARFDVQYVTCRSQLMMGFYEQDVAIPGISSRACRQPSEHIHSIHLKNVSLMVNITRLKHQKGGFAWIDTWAIEREVLCRSCEWNVGFDIVKGTWVVTEVLSLKQNDSEIGRHGFKHPREAMSISPLFFLTFCYAGCRDHALMSYPRPPRSGTDL